jgi:3-carboxy-cis,cis-muconate cycloisomerase
MINASAMGSVTGNLLSDNELATLFSDEAAVREMVTVEAALARVEGHLGIIPSVAAETIERAAASFEPSMAELRAGAESAGVPVIALVEQLRAAVGDDAANYVHWGATSQDIIDTALVLRLRLAVDIFAKRLDNLIASLGDLAAHHRATPMVARTRFQNAVPTTFGLEVAGWRVALQSDATRLRQLRPRLLVVQFGGAAGNLAALGNEGLRVVEGLADELGLNVPTLPWHAHREAVAELASWLALVTGSLGKLGLDVLQHAQTDIGEIRIAPAAADGSSTMPHKTNPISAEVLVTLGRMNAGLVGPAHQALLHAQQRDGSAWQLEWMTLPQMVVNCGAALARTANVIDTLEVDSARMESNLLASNGIVFAETATFALANHMSRAEAYSVVKEACAESVRAGTPLRQILEEISSAPVDWTEVFSVGAATAAAAALVDRALASSG